MEQPTPRGGIELLGEGDYQQFLIELSAFQLASEQRFDPLVISHTLDLLNKSYDLMGEGVVTADKGLEILELPPELVSENLMDRQTQKIFSIDEQFTHTGHSLGFRFNIKTGEFMLSFTDTENPFNIQIAEFEGDDMVIPQPVRTIHVPVFVPHSVSMINGYKLESQLAA